MLFEGKLQNYPDLERLLNQDEQSLTESLLKDLEHLKVNRPEISTQAMIWIESIQKAPARTFNIQKLLQAFPLAGEEGRSLMAIAEAYLRTPDSFTANLLLKDKISGRSWRKKDGNDGNLITASRWGLDFLNYLQGSSWSSLVRPFNLRAFKIFMHLLSREFILGQTIEEAVKRSLKSPQDRFSFDMLGEGARTSTMALTYKNAYKHAIQTIGKIKESGTSLFERDSISIKLSALYSHYTFSHQEEVLRKLLPDLIELCSLARAVGISLIIDAEEAARLELSLDLIEKVCETKELKGWEGFGFAVQAYQKRAPAVIDWAEALSRRTKMPLFVRLVKGAYWDTEIKIAQMGGYPEYPLFTRKAATDLSYLVCAKKLLAAQGSLYPQFATHNAFTVAAVLAMVGERSDVEFQRLQGMGEDLYKTIRKTQQVPVRVYAPVGNDRDLLPYLVRRLLENGANTSFVHKIYNKSLSSEQVVGDPWSFFETHPPGRHPQIPLPKDLFGKTRRNSKGYDLSDRKTLGMLKAEIKKAEGKELVLKEASLKDLKAATREASAHWETWDLTTIERRGEILNLTAELLEERQGLFLGLLIKEGKKTLPDAVSELREAVDYCRYYAAEALKHFSIPQTLQGPTGELNQLVLRGRGVFACISPWNFPLAIFMGQVAAALASGNAVIAKPATLTPLIAYHAVQIMHEAGVPREVLHFLHGKGSVLGTPLVEDLKISGVVFTGSISTAQEIQKSLSVRGGPIVPFIAETGGLNAMIVDSSALIEQVVDDVIVSSFQSTGQRCSALRIIFIQDDIYEHTLAMLREAMEELTVGDPQWLSTDVGPVIDAVARDDIEAYIASHSPLARTPLPKVKGTFVAPTLIEVKGMEDVKKEVFGPVLHVARFKAKDLEKVVHSINQSGYGLTMGLESRIEETINKVRALAHVGNLYINRSMIGAVVGVQPFGGEGLSGSGPKAGGPYYLPRFAVERSFSYNIMARGGNVDLLNLEE
ncbi:MAG TPA: L-glutamate gamma-semialdehyde dehydrogenase [Alphaproteobacteria bacterium]|nr:L-glutamate gamma-semialdehyde dehydrogenase [Alphaproteobacteria bacterium]